MAIIQGNAKQGSTRGFYPKVINGSLRFNDDDSAYLSWTPASAGNRKTWTWSGWVKRGNITSNQVLFAAGNGTYDSRTEILLDANDNVYFINDNRANSGTYNIVDTTGIVFRDSSAWYHFVVVIDTTQSTDTNRVKMYVNGQQLTLTQNNGYPAQNLDTFISSTSIHYIGKTNHNTSPNQYLDAYLADVHFIDGQALTADDFGETKNGVWVAKDYAGTFGTNGFYLTFEDDTQVEAFNTVLYKGNNTTQSVTGTGFQPDLVWIKARNTAAMGHILTDSVRGAGKALISNATNAEDVNHQYGYLSSFDSDGYTVTKGSTNADRVNNSSYNYVGWCWDAGANNAVTGHSSVTFTGATGGQTISGFPFSPDLVWIKERTDADAHLLFDSVRGPNKKIYSNLTNAETTVTNELMSFTNDGFILGSSGNVSTSGNNLVAWAWDAGDSDPVTNTDGSITSTVKASTTNGFSIVEYTGNGTSGATVGHGLSSAPDFMVVKRTDSTGNWFSTHSSLTDGYVFYWNLTNAAVVSTAIFNDTAPDASTFTLGNGNSNNSGGTFIAYCWHDVTGKQKFGTYTGNNSATGPTITTGFRPGFVMIKRTDSVGGWYLKDSSRNPLGEQTLFLDASDSDAEATGAQVTFSDTGFQITNPDAGTNASGGTYIYAAFAGSYSDYITDYNTDGSIDSRVKANDTTGFSIVSYTGTGANATVGHGLSSAPDMVIIKDRDSATNFWVVGHTSLSFTSDNYLRLNGTGASEAGGGVAWNNTAPTSTTVSIGNSTVLNASGNDYIAYCWSETTGYSKFGSYSGGTTSNKITTGFKPALIIVKNTTNAFGWWMVDNTRDVDGTLEEFLFANASDAEGTSGSNRISVQSDGFTLLDTGNPTNASGSTYIYAAFADTREAAFWLDQSGNDNDWQPVNLDHNDTVADSPTNNFCTLNPLNNNNTLSNGNLRAVTGINTNSTGTMAFSSGQHYFEVTVVTAGGSYPFIGLAPATFNAIGSTTSFVAGTSKWVGNGGLSNGDVVGIAFDLDTNTFHAHINGTYLVSGSSYWDGSGMEATVDAWMPCISGVSSTFECNFGQQPFKYDPPA